MSESLTTFSGPNCVAIAIAREAEGLTQKEFAELIGTTQANLSKIESGSAVASSEIIRKMSEVTGYPVPFFHSHDIQRISIHHWSYNEGV